MQKIENYEIVQTLPGMPFLRRYRARRKGDADTCILTVLDIAHAKATDVAFVKQAYQNLADHPIIGISPVFKVKTGIDVLIIVQADIKGESLRALLKKAAFDIETSVSVGIALAGALGHLHQARMIHGAIRPVNIQVDMQDLGVTMLDLGVLSRLRGENDFMSGGDGYLEVLPYISPEQTGRINRPVDYRSDLYATGVVLYEMVTGHVPFTQDTPLEIMHAHIAGKPLPPAGRSPDVPRVLSRIIMKLLSKTVEKRYQNAFGLAADLSTCLKQLQDNGKIASFTIGSQDSPISVTAPAKCIGREIESAVLAHALNRVESGANGIAIVSGAPGVGKSFLISEMRRPVLDTGGYFISGKYEQLSRDMPYQAIAQALGSLVRQVLSESRERIDRLRAALSEMLGPNIRIMTDLLPDLRLIVGDPSVVPVLSPEAARNRFYMVLRNFLKVFAKPGHPLVLFLDDLQWADVPSLKLLEQIFLDPELGYFLFIGACRDAAPGEVHPFSETRKILKTAGVHIDEIRLSPLKVEDVDQYLQACLGVLPERSRPLARRVHFKTNGNPFFIHQFMETLSDKGLLLPDVRVGWRWDIRSIDHMSETDNVVDLMAGKISRLNANTRNLLKTCACFGGRFSLDQVAVFLGMPLDTVMKDLTEALQEGLVQAAEDRFKFVHDRVREAVYLQIPEKEKQARHLAIGRFLLKALDKKGTADAIFAAVNQLNLARDLLSDPIEKDALAELNLKAGRQAKKAAAYASAFSYLRTGIAMLGDTAWQRQYGLTLALYRAAVEAAYLTTDFDEMERLSQVAFQHVTSILDRVDIDSVRIRTRLARNQLLDAVEVGLETLTQLGMQFPKEPGTAHQIAGLLKTRMRLLGRTVEGLGAMPEMQSRMRVAQIRIMSMVVPAVYWARPNLLPLMVFKMVRLFCQYGNTPLSPYTYAGYGLILCGIGEIDAGYRFGKMALALLELMQLKEQYARTHFVHNAFIAHWKAPLAGSLEKLLECYRTGVETGDFEFAAFSLQIYCYHAICVGENLERVESDIQKYSNAIRMLGQTTQLNMTQLHHQVVLNLQGKAETPWCLEGDAYSETKMLPRHVTVGDRTILFTLYFYKLMLHYFFGHHEIALENAEKACAEYDSVIGSYIVAEYVFFDALNRLALTETATPNQKKRLLKKIAASRRKLKKWARHAPMNFRHKYELIRAEWYRVTGAAERAAAAYDRAIESAEAHHYQIESGLACELAAVFYQACKMKKRAGYYLSEAFRMYAAWGAEGLLKAKQDRYIGLSVSQGGDNRIPVHDALDYGTVVTALQAISTELILDELLEKLIRIMAENAGADRVLYISITDDKAMRVAAAYETEGGNGRKGDGAGADRRRNTADNDDDMLLPAANYVKRTLEYIVLDDVEKQGDYMFHPYVLRYRPKSVLCLPVIRQKKLMGMLYLENTLTPGAFTVDRINVLKLLASQAAISIENATLYNNLSNALESLEESERKYRLLAENVTDIIWIFDLATMRYSYQSPSVKQLRGFEPGEAMAMTLQETLPPDSLEKAFGILEEELALEESGAADPARIRKMEVENYCKDGSRIWIEARMRFLRDGNGRPVSILGVTRDITDRKAADAEIKRLNLELEERVRRRTAELQKSIETLKNTQNQLIQSEKMAALGGLVAGVAHEINTPLGICLTASSLLEDKTAISRRLFDQGRISHEDLEKYFKTAGEASSLICRNIGRAAELVNSFKLVAVDQSREECRWFNMRDYIDDMLIGFQPKLRTAGHKIKVTCPDDISLYSYPGFFYQIISNLVMNSVIHGFEKKKNGHIEIDIWKEGDWLVICYRDDGKGMDRETLDRMYDPFFTTKRTHGGTGLGMHILYNLISQSLKGQMECTSAIGKGVVFLIRIPTNQSEQDAYCTQLENHR